MKHHKSTLTPIDPSAATPAQEALFAKAKGASQGTIPNMIKRMANSPPLLDAYLHGHALFRAQSGFNSVEQEIIFLVLSLENGCDYCVAAHSFMADTFSKVPTDVTEAIRYGEAIENEKFAALAAMTRDMLLRRGFADPDTVKHFFSVGYSETHLLNLVLAVSIKTLTNYSNHLFQPEVDTIFKVVEFTAFKAAKRVISFFTPRSEVL